MRINFQKLFNVYVSLTLVTFRKLIHVGINKTLLVMVAMTQEIGFNPL